jgi:hypothetical protein
MPTPQINAQLQIMLNLLPYFPLFTKRKKECPGEIPLDVIYPIGNDLPNKGILQALFLKTYAKINFTSIPALLYFCISSYIIIDASSVLSKQ